MRFIGSVRGRRLRALVILVLLAAGVFWAGKFLHSKGLAWAANFSGVVSMVLAGIALLMPLFARMADWINGPRPVTSPQIEAARDKLAAVLGQEWAEEERLRRIYDPRPLPVRWEVTTSASAATAISANSTVAGLAGQFAEIRPLLLRLSPARLVILGAAGAGKSVLAIKLAHDLLEARAPRSAVPVVLQASTWDIEAELTDWIAGQLARRQAGLAQQVKDSSGAVVSLGQALVMNKMIFPIIDGFDEIPETLRGRAIEKINRFGSDKVLVLTSRPAEFQAAVTAVGRGIAGAAVVELLPLRVAEAEQYLSEATAVNPPGRWEGVFGLLDSEPDGPLARVLRTPLMLWMARTVYESSLRDPAELTDRGRLTDRDNIEKYLLDAFIPAAYSDSAVGRRPRYRAGQADRWLGFLANYVSRSGESGIAWWQLCRATPWWNRLRAGLGVVVTLNLMWLVMARLLALHGRWRPGGYIARDNWTSWIGGPLGWRAAPEIRYLKALYRAPANQGVRSFVSSIIRFLAHFKTLLPWISFSHFEMAAIGLGIVAAISVGPADNPPLKLHVRPLRLARKAAITASKAALWSVFITIAAAPVVLSLSSSSSSFHLVHVSVHSRDAWRAVLVLSLWWLPDAVGSIAVRIDVAGSLNAGRTLRMDQRAWWVSWLKNLALLCTTLWLLFGPEITLAFAVYAVASRLILTFIGDIYWAAPRYTQARIALFVSGRAPWRLMQFLEDAYRRGALRQVGAVYQFRHIRLQERLAEAHPPLAARLAGRAERKWLEVLQTRWPELLVSTVSATDFAWDHGWQVSVDSRTLTVTCRDPRFDRFVGAGDRVTAEGRLADP